MNNKFDKVAITYNNLCSSKRKFTGSQYKALGLNIKVKTKTKTNQTVTVITVSSKVLHEKCIDLISFQNIHQVHMLVSEYLDVTFNEFINGEVNSLLEVTEDVSVSVPSNTVGSLFKLAKLQTNYVTKSKPYRNNMQLPTSFGLKKDCLTAEHGDYFSCYVKRNELLRRDNRENQWLLNTITIDQRERVLRYYEDKVRLEVKVHSIEKIRQHFKIPKNRKPTLRDILTSEVPVVLNMYENIYSRVVESRQHAFSGKKEKELLYHMVLEQVNFDMAQAFEWLNSHMNYKVPRRVKEVLRRLIKSHEQGHEDKLVTAHNEMLNALQKSL